MALVPVTPIPASRHRVFQNYVTYEATAMNYGFFTGDQKERSMNMRKIAMGVIQKYSKGENFDAFIPYLAMVYFDRFISKNHISAFYPEVEDEEDIPLFALCCLFLAWKMRTSTFKVHDFLTRWKLDPRIELHVLMTELQMLHQMHWRITVTPFCFVGLLVAWAPRKFSAGNLRTIDDIIIQGQSCEALVKYRDSVIAAAVVITACSTPFPSVSVVGDCEYVTKDWVFQGHFDANSLMDCLKDTVAMCEEKEIINHAANEETSTGLDKEKDPSKGESSGTGAGREEAMEEVEKKRNDKAEGGTEESSAHSRRAEKQPMVVEAISEVEEGTGRAKPLTGIDLRWITDENEANEVFMFLREEPSCLATCLPYCGVQ